VTAERCWWAWLGPAWSPGALPPLSARCFGAGCAVLNVQQSALQCQLPNFCSVPTNYSLQALGGAARASRLPARPHMPPVIRHVGIRTLCMWLQRRRLLLLPRA